MLKIKIRKKILKLRRFKFNVEKEINFSRLKNILKKNLSINSAVGGYYPVNYEIDDLNILRELELKNYNISLPVVKKNNHMDFYKWSFKDTLQVNKYGIPEPHKKKLIYPDILLVPLVAFDKRKFRLGYGGGFYDRYIEKIKKRKRVITIGLAFDFQKVKKIPNNMHDMRLDIILTNNNFFK